MMREPFLPMATATLLALTMSACGSESAPSADAADAAAPAVAIPATLAPFGDGYPDAGDPCRRLGEAEATREWLDDSADLVGCPTAAAAAALGGRTLATVEGVTVISVPRAGGEAGPTGAAGANDDALVAGTNFNATAEIRCSADGSAPTTMCRAGVRRRTAPDGLNIVEVSKAGGGTRAIYFDGNRATGADGAEADGSAGYDFRATRQGDDTLVEYGPERYVVPDALVVGG